MPTDPTSMPTTTFLALGAVLAALVAGFFSLVNLISAKESNVSDSRQKWIDGLRGEISEFTAAVHELVRLRESRPDPCPTEWEALTSNTYNLARKNLSSIYLRMNPEAISKKPDSHEAKLLTEIQKIRTEFKDENYEQVVLGCDRIRDVASVFLKSEWERVKSGEFLYRTVRTTALIVIIVGVVAVAVSSIWLVIKSA